MPFDQGFYTTHQLKCNWQLTDTDESPIILWLTLKALSFHKQFWFKFLLTNGVTFSQISRKEDINREVYRPKFSEISHQEFPFHMIFLPEIIGRNFWLFWGVCFSRIQFQSFLWIFPRNFCIIYMSFKDLELTISFLSILCCPILSAHYWSTIFYLSVWLSIV